MSSFWRREVAAVKIALSYLVEESQVGSEIVDISPPIPSLKS
jgi:hypothetical protein